MPPNGASLATAWEGLDPDTRLRLAIIELDRLYARLDSMQAASAEDHSHIRREITNTVAAIKSDFNERITTLRTEVTDGFAEIERRQNRSIGLLYTMIGGIVVGLVLLVVQLASH